MNEPILERCYVYRFFDARDRLLYVGITRDIRTRTAAHERTSSWWSAVSRAQWQIVPSRAQAAEAEAIAIAGEGPIHNAAQPPLPTDVDVYGEQLRIVAEAERLRGELGVMNLDRIRAEGRANAAEKDAEQLRSVLADARSEIKLLDALLAKARWRQPSGGGLA